MKSAKFLFASGSLATAANTRLLFAAGTGGKLSTLSFNLTANGANALTEVASTDNCGPVPAWLTLDAEERNLFCLDDSANGNGSINMFSIDADGGLSLTSRMSTPAGPVSSTVYQGPAGKRLAVAF